MQSFSLSDPFTHRTLRINDILMVLEEKNHFVVFQCCFIQRLSSNNPVIREMTEKVNGFRTALHVKATNTEGYINSQAFLTL